MPTSKSKTTRNSRTKKTARPHVLIVRAPGTNCEHETAHAFERAGADTSIHHIGEIVNKKRLLRDTHGFVIPGGFSFGDDVGAGTVFSTILRTKLRDPLRQLVDRGGIILGICNGFQVLTKSGLLPGFRDASDDAPTRLISLATNAQNRYEDRWITLKAVSETSVFFKPGDVLRCPIAHAEGRLVPKDEATRKRLWDNQHVALIYVDERGRDAKAFPDNPNGSTDNIAGLVDHTGQILGLMPHPERNQFVWQDPRFHGGGAPKQPEGMAPFKNAVRYLKRRH